MNDTRDFTKFTIGQTVDGELIVTCPYCHKYAVRRENLGVQFVHSIDVVKTNGRTELLEDACPAKPVLSRNRPKVRD
jgi:hypothetical protein